MKNNSSPTEKFGPFVRKLRLNLNITQRELAKKVGIAPSYLNDLGSQILQTKSPVPLLGL